MSLRRRAPLALCGLLGLFALYHLAIQPALSELASGVPHINSYGRQRMLSQRLAKGVLAAQYDLPEKERRLRVEEVAQTLAEWSEQHARLLNDDSAYVRSSEIDQAVSALDRHFQTMRRHSARFLELMRNAPETGRDERQRLSLELLAEEPQFLSRMNHIVGLYEADVQRRVERLQLAGWLIFLLLIAVAAFLHVGVVSPAIRTLSSRYQSHLLQYRTLVENMNDGLALVDRLGEIRFANQRLKSMLQLNGESVDWNRLDDYLMPMPGGRSALLQAIVHHGIVETRLQRQAENTSLDVIIRCQRIREDADNNSAVTLVVVTDITSEKAGRERLRELQDQLSRVQRLKTVGEMSASLAHELGQPLGAISAFVGSCRHQLDAGNLEPHQLQERLQRVERAATRAGEILKRFRAYGRHSSLQPISLDFAAMVAEVEELCGPLLKDAGTALHCQIEQQLPAVSGDPLLIQQVLINLIQNAVQALEGERVERHAISLTVQEEQEGAGVEIVITDRGRGIPAELLPRLTEPFFTTRPTGLGLGLSICRTIIEDHEGRLCMASEPGVGTTVRLLLPTAVSETAHA